MVPALPLRLMWNAGAIAAAAGDLASSGYCLFAMTESDVHAGLPEESSIIANHLLSPGALLRRRMAQAVIAARFGDEQFQLRFHICAFGAPKLSGAPFPLHVSFSARKTMGIVGIGITPIGVDLEERINREAIPLNILRDDERNLLSACAGDIKVEAFLRLWTLKEAMVKACGRGFNIPPEQVIVGKRQVIIAQSAEKPSPMISGTILTSASIRAFTPRNIDCDERRILDAYVAAIALNEGNPGNCAWD